MIAGIIDSIIISIIAWIITLLIVLPSGGTWPLRASDFLQGVLLFLYAVFFESTRGTTIGKQIMYLKVTTVDGKLPTLDRTVIRDISKINGLLWLIDILVGMATLGDPHQKYSDRYAGTTVVSTISRGFILPSPPTSPVPPPSSV